MCRLKAQNSRRKTRSYEHGPAASAAWFHDVDEALECECIFIRLRARRVKERVGKILQVHAYGIVNKCKGHHENFNPDLLDVDRLIQDILIAVDTFKHKEGNGI